MEKGEKIFRLAEIIAKSFREKLSEEERTLLEKWLAVSENNRKQYTRYRSEAFLQRKRQEHAAIDWQTDYRSFIAKHQLNKQSISLRTLFKYAAIWLLPLVAGIMLWQWNLSKQELPVARNQPSVHIGAAPILTLANGQKIMLTDSIGKNAISGADLNPERNTLTYLPTTDSVSPEKVSEPVYNRLEIPRGAEYFLTLSDGTKIWLNSETVLRYPESFLGRQREVFVEGEAYFQVKHDPLHPFIVHAAQSRIEVLGTEFNVRTYRDETAIATTLVEGSVSMTSETQNVILRPGQQGCVTQTDGQLTVRKVDTYLYTAWKDSRFVFRNARMEDLLNTLARWYDLTIFYQNSETKAIRFTGDMSRMDNFQQLLNIIENNERVRFTVNNRTVTVSLK